MAVFFEDATPDFNRTSTIAVGEATATDGTKVVEIGFTGDADEFLERIQRAARSVFGRYASPGVIAGHLRFCTRLPL